MNSLLYPIVNFTCGLTYGGSRFLAKVGVIDYEAKPIEKIPRWYEQQMEILQCFKEDSALPTTKETGH